LKSDGYIPNAYHSNRSIARNILMCRSDLLADLPYHLRCEKQFVGIGVAIELLPHLFTAEMV
jgi:hypothetical protein